MADNPWFDAYQKAVTLKQQKDLEQARLAIESRNADTSALSEKDTNAYRQAMLELDRKRQAAAEEAEKTKNALAALGIIGGGNFAPIGAAGAADHVLNGSPTPMPNVEPSPAGMPGQGASAAPMSMEPNMSVQPNAPGMTGPPSMAPSQGGPLPMAAPGGPGPLDVSKIPGLGEAFGNLGVQSLRPISPAEKAFQQAAIERQVASDDANAKRAQLLGWGQDLLTRYPEITKDNPNAASQIALFASGMSKAIPEETQDHVKAVIEKKAFDALKNNDIAGYKMHKKWYDDFGSSGLAGSVGWAKLGISQNVQQAADQIRAKVAQAHPGTDPATLQQLAIQEAMTSQDLKGHQNEVVEAIKASGGGIAKPLTPAEEMMDAFFHPEKYADRAGPVGDMARTTLKNSAAKNKMH